MLSIKSCFCLAYFVLFFTPFSDVEAASANFTSVHIGLILDSKSPVGAMVDSCISMAIWDFYAAHPDYRTRLILHRKDAMEELDVASAALELMKNDEVHSILGPQMVGQDKFVAELGGRARVPVISFTSTSSSSSSSSSKQSPYFIRTAPDDSIQANALASLCKGFGWHQVVVLYEDIDYGAQFLAKVMSVFQEDVDFKVQVASSVAISSSAEDREISSELSKLKGMQTRVFLVHMNPDLASRLFLLANQAGMMSQGYAWLVTDSLGNFMSSIDDSVIESMEGVIGLRPYVPKSKNTDNFRARWKKKMILESPESTATDLNVYGLWTYDTVWALAIAVEKIGPVNPAFLMANSGKDDGKNRTEIFNLGVSQFGPKLLSELQNLTFSGLSGEFNLTNGQLKTSALEIFNVFSPGERILGFWSPEKGLMRKLSSNGAARYSTSVDELKSILWPGDSSEKPKGWAIPSSGKLRVGIPKKDGFKEFVNVSIDPQTKKVQNATGFSIDVFLLVLNKLDFHFEYEFVAFINESVMSNGTYDDLLHAIPNKTFDMVVGDTTILSDRSAYVDFTLPYSETGTVMVVKNKEGRDIWIFVKPFRWDLWLLIFSTCLLIGIVLRILERHAIINSDSIGPKKHNLGLPFWFPIAALAFPESNMVTNKWSRFVMVIWLLMAFILMQSYTANLSAMLTVDQLDFRFTNDDFVGCQDNTFVRDFLMNKLKIDKSRIKEYGTAEEYHDVMTKGSQKGGIDAIFDEIPYMKLFLDKYDSEYKVVGPTYRTDGFGFAFPRDSPLVIDFSRAILNVTESAEMTELEKRHFGQTYSSSNNQINSIGTQSSKLAAYDFGGLFIIIGSALVFALFCSETSIGKKLTDLIAKFTQKSFFFHSFGRSDSRVHSINDHGDHGNGNRNGNGNGNGDSSSDGEEEAVQVSNDHIIQESRQLGNSSIAPDIQMSEINVPDRQNQLVNVDNVQ